MLKWCLHQRRGDFHSECGDNWCGISLFHFTGKIFARVIQERLKVIAERILQNTRIFLERVECVVIRFLWQGNSQRRQENIKTP